MRAASFWLGCEGATGQRVGKILQDTIGFWGEFGKEEIWLAVVKAAREYVNSCDSDGGNRDYQFFVELNDALADAGEVE